MSKISNKMKLKKIALENSKDQIKIGSPVNDNPKFTINKYYIDCNSLNECLVKNKKASLNNTTKGKKSLSNERISKKNANQTFNKPNPNNKILINCMDEKPKKKLDMKDKKVNLTKPSLMPKNKDTKKIDDSPAKTSNKNDNIFNDQYKRTGLHTNSLKVNKNDGIMNRIKQSIKESNNPSKFINKKKGSNPFNILNTVNKPRLSFTNPLSRSLKNPIKFFNFVQNSSKDENKSQNNSDNSEDKNKIKKKIESDTSSHSSVSKEKEDEKIIAKSKFEIIGKSHNHEIAIDNSSNNNNKINLNNIKRNSKKTNTEVLKTVHTGKRGYRNSVQQNEMPMLNDKIILSSVLSKPGLCDEKEKTNQDSYLIKENLFCLGFHLYGIFDGHGENGHLISKYISKFINDFYSEESNYANINDNTSSKKSENKIFLDNYTKIIKNQKNNLDTMINSKISFDISQSGSTSLLLFLTDNTLICSNVGDSECYLFNCSEDDLWTFESLSKMHRPTDEIEKKRILEKGGEIHPYYDENGIFDGPDRIYVKNKPYPGLSLSRTIGDSEGKKIGIISDPDISIKKIEENSKFIIMGSDGLWDVIKPYDASRMVRSYFNKGDTDGACKVLLKKAEQMYKKNNEERDDITIIVIFIGKPNIQVAKDSNKYLHKIIENVNAENEGSTTDVPLILKLG